MPIHNMLDNRLSEAIRKSIAAGARVEEIGARALEKVLPRCSTSGRSDSAKL